MLNHGISIFQYLSFSFHEIAQIRIWNPGDVPAMALFGKSF